VLSLYCSAYLSADDILSPDEKTPRLIQLFISDFFKSYH